MSTQDPWQPSGAQQWQQPPVEGFERQPGQFPQQEGPSGQQSQHGRPDPSSQPAAYGQPPQTNPYAQLNPYAQTDPYAQPNPHAQTNPYAQPNPFGQPTPYATDQSGVPGPVNINAYGVSLYGQSPYGQPMVVAPKSPGLSLLASFFIPGLGTIINGEVGKGAGILIGYVVCWALAILVVPLLGVLGLWIWGMVDAYQGAQSWNRAHGIIS